MDNRAVALKLILDDLGTNDISSTENRMEVQKAVYLVQASGISLGYTYGWYLKGPYSPSLTRDYYSLSEDTVPPETTLKTAAREKIEQLRKLMDQGIGNLRRPQRLELIASLHYLLKNSSFSEAQATDRIRETKPHLALHVADGLAVLKESNLL